MGARILLGSRPGATRCARAAPAIQKPKTVLVFKNRQVQKCCVVSPAVQRARRQT